MPPVNVRGSIVQVAAMVGITPTMVASAEASEESIKRFGSEKVGKVTQANIPSDQLPSNIVKNNRLTGSQLADNDDRSTQGYVQ